MTEVVPEIAGGLEPAFEELGDPEIPLGPREEGEATVEPHAAE